MAHNVIIPQPCLLVRGDIGNPKDEFLVIENAVLCKIKDCKYIPLVLLASFYVFNIHYPPGLVNLYTFLECIILQFQAPKERARVNNLLIQLSQTKV